MKWELGGRKEKANKSANLPAQAAPQTKAVNVASNTAMCNPPV
jgi:hypothetical protein